MNSQAEIFKPEARIREPNFAPLADGHLLGDPTPEARRPRLGLALSSGGAKGLAHIGVIQVLEENGIPIDVVVGCSMGAYVAAIWGFGHDGATMERLARQVEGRFGLWRLVDPMFPPRQGFMRGCAVKML